MQRHCLGEAEKFRDHIILWQIMQHNTKLYNIWLKFCRKHYKNNFGGFLRVTVYAAIMQFQLSERSMWILRRHPGGWI